MYQHTATRGPLALEPLCPPFYFDHAIPASILSPQNFRLVFVPFRHSVSDALDIDKSFLSNFFFCGSVSPLKYTSFFGEDDGSHLADIFFLWASGCHTHRSRRESVLLRDPY